MRVVLSDRHLAGQDHEHARADFAGPQQTFARAVRPRVAEAVQASISTGSRLENICSYRVSMTGRGCSHGRFLEALRTELPTSRLTLRTYVSFAILQRAFGSAAPAARRFHASSYRGGRERSWNHAR